MTETAQKMLEVETPEWVKTFLANWEDSKKQNPSLSLVESIEIDIRLRSLLKPLFNSYVGQ